MALGHRNGIIDGAGDPTETDQVLKEVLGGQPRQEQATTAEKVTAPVVTDVRGEIFDTMLASYPVADENGARSID